MIDINVSYDELREAMWMRLEPFWAKKYKETVLAAEDICLTWNNNVRLNENKDGIGKGFIRHLFFSKNGKKNAVAINPHKNAVSINVVVPEELIEIAEQNRDQAELREREKVRNETCLR